MKKKHLNFKSNDFSAEAEWINAYKLGNRTYAASLNDAGQNAR